MAVTKSSNLVKLGDTDLTVADPSEEIGHVDALLVDAAENKVRFLQVASGGFLGIGERTFLLPVDAVAKIDDDHVHVDQTRERVAGSPAYDPDLAYEQDYYGGLSGYYGYAPYWGAGYVYPGYPYYA